MIKSSIEVPQQYINEFLFNISMTNNNNVNNNNLASSYFRFLLTNPDSINLILSILNTENLSQNAYIFALLILQEKIRQPSFHLMQQKSNIINETLCKAIFTHQNQYQHIYYRLLIETYADFIVLSNNLNQLPKQIIHPIQCLHFYQMLNTLNSFYIFSFFTDNMIMNKIEQTLILAKEYINSLFNMPTDLKVNREWILLIKTLLQNDLNILEFKIILETIEFSIQNLGNDYYSELNELLCTIFNNYSFLPSPDASFLSEESNFMYPFILKNSFLFSDVLMAKNLDTILINLWSNIVQFPILETIQSFEDETFQLFALFLTSLSKTLIFLEKSSLSFAFDIIIKFPSIFEYINSDLLHLQVTNDFFNNIIHHLIHILLNSSFWNNRLLEEAISFIYQLVPELFSKVIVNSQPISSLFYICSIIKCLPKDIITSVFQKLFSLDTLPTSGLLFIRSNLSIFSGEYPNLLSQLFVMNDRAKSDPDFLLFESLILKDLILNANPETLNFNIFSQNVLDFLTQTICINSPIFNLYSYKNCFISLIYISLRINEDSSRHQFYQQIKKAFSEFCQFVINSSKYMNDHFPVFLKDILIALSQIQSKHVNEAYFIIANTINENISNKLLETMTCEAQEISINLTNSMLTPKLCQFLPKEAVLRITKWIMSCLSNGFLMTGYIDVLVSLFHIQVVPPPQFICSFLYHISKLNNEACEMVYCSAKYLLLILQSTDADFWQFFPPSFLISMSCSHYQPTNELLLHLIFTLVGKNGNFPPNYLNAACLSLVIVFFNVDSSLLIKAAEIVSTVCARGGASLLQELIMKMAESAAQMKPLLVNLHEALGTFFADKSEGKLGLMRFESQLKFFLIDNFDSFRTALQTWCSSFFKE